MVEKDAFGNKYWFNSQKRFHREDGPAIEYIDGAAFWYRNGRRHREDGAAVEYVSGYKEYWYDGEYFSGVGDDLEWERVVRLVVFR